MRLYADENFPLAVTEALRTAGHDVLTAYDDGRANLAIPDENVLHRAMALSRILLTLNRQDFKRLHGMHPNHAGIVSCTYDPVFLLGRQRESIARCKRLLRLPAGWCV